MKADEIPSAPEPDIPQLGDKEKDREKKGAGVWVGSGSGAGPGATLVPGPVLQAAKVLLGFGASVGVTQPSLLRDMASFTLFRLLPMVALGLLALTPFYAWRKAAGGPASAGGSKLPAAFRHHSSSVEPTQAGEGNTDSLAYLIAGNQTRKQRDSESIKEPASETPAASPAPDAKADAPAPKPASPLPAAAAKELQEAMKKAAAQAPPAASAKDNLAGGLGMAKGIQRKFDAFGNFGRLAAALKPGLTGDFGAQRNPNVGKLTSGGKIKASMALDQLFLTHQKSRASLSAGSAEGKAAGADQAFSGRGGAASAPVRPSSAGGKSNSPGQTGDSFDGGPLSTPYGGTSDAPAAGQSEDISPWTPDINTARDKLQDASSLITAIGMLAPFKAIPIIGAIAAMVQGILYNMAISYVNNASQLGAGVQNNWGQNEQSDIVLTGSAITAAAAAAALAAPVATTAWTSVIAGVTGMAALVAILLLPKK